MTELALEYRRSAEQIHTRIAELKAKAERRTDEMEERIVLLQAEYYHLLRIAHYLEHYYDGDVLEGETA